MSVVYTSINTLTCIQVLHQRTLLPEEIHQQSKFRFRAQGFGFGDGVFHWVHSHLEFLVRSCNKVLPTISLSRHHNKYFINIQTESIHNRNYPRALQRNSIHFSTGYFYKINDKLVKISMNLSGLHVSNFGIKILKIYELWKKYWKIM